MSKIKLKQSTFDLLIDDKISAANLLNEKEVVLYTGSGDVILYNMQTEEYVNLLADKNFSKFTTSGLDPELETTIYTMNNIIVIVNDYGRYGRIINLDEKYILDISREDYYIEHCKYPIALFEDEAGDTNLIFTVAWNDMQVVNLRTRQSMTIDKSLVEVGAEERHLNFYKNHEESNKLFWPRKYDYFYGKLHISPNQESVLSCGWDWGSIDSLKVYDIKKFILDKRISDVRIGEMLEHMNRPACFVDNNTVAFLYCEADEGWIEKDEAEKSKLDEIHFYTTTGNFINKIIIPEKIFVGKVDMNFNIQHKYFVIYSKECGTTIVTLSGEILYQNKDLMPERYNMAQNMLISYTNRNLQLYEINLINS